MPALGMDPGALPNDWTAISPSLSHWKYSLVTVTALTAGAGLQQAGCRFTYYSVVADWLGLGNAAQNRGRIAPCLRSHATHSPPLLSSGVYIYWELLLELQRTISQLVKYGSFYYV